MFVSAKTLRLPAQKPSSFSRLIRCVKSVPRPPCRVRCQCRHAKMLLSLVLSVHGQNIFVHCLNEPEGALTREVRIKYHTVRRWGTPKRLSRWSR